jgi:autotransporter-associated beta strand protein
MKTKFLRHLGTTALLLFIATATARGADGSWNVDADGDWAVPGNWLGNIIADGPGSTAYFTNDTTTLHTITFTTRTNGNLSFGDGDTSTPGGWILSGTNIFLTNSLAKPIITVTPINNGDATNDARIATGILTGAQGFIKRGLGTLTLNGADTIGPVQIDAGLITIANTNSLGAGTQTVTYNGGGVRFYTGGPNFSNTNFVSTAGIIVNSNGNYDGVLGPFTGTGTMYIHSTARLSIGGGGGSTPGVLTNFFGTFDLSDSSSGSEIRFNMGGGALYDMSTITLNGGTNAGRIDFRMLIPGTVRIGAITGGPGSHLQASQNGGGNPLTWEIGYLNQTNSFNGSLQDQPTSHSVGNLMKVGTGKLILNGTNTYSGSTIVSNGVLALGATGLISNTNGSFSVVSSTAIFDVSAITPAWTNNTTNIVSGIGTIAGTVAFMSGTIRPGNNGIGQITFANTLYLDGTQGVTTNLAEIGTGTNDMVVVGGDLSLAGIIAVRCVPTGPVIPNGTYPLFKWGGNLIGDLSNLALEFPPQTGTLTLGTNLVTKTIFLQVTGVSSSLNLSWQGDGVANAWDFATANWRNGASLSPFHNGDKVTFDDTGSNNVPVDITAPVGASSIVVNSTSNYVFSSSGGLGKLSGGGSLLKTNSGMLTITTDNDYLGDTTNAQGVLKIGNEISTGTLGAGNLINNGTVVFDRGNDLAFSSAISGTGALVKNDPSTTLTLSGANTYSGNTIISNGTVTMSTSASIGSGTIVLAGGTLNPLAQVNNPIQVIADSLLSSTVADLPINGTPSGNAGTLSVNDTAGNGFRFVQGTSFTFNRPITLQSGTRTIAFYNIGSTQTYNGVIAGGGGLHRRSPNAGSANDAVGGHTIFNAANTYSGTTTLSEGNVGLGTSTVLDVDNVTILSGPLGTAGITYSPPAQPSAPFGFIVFYGVGGARTVANPITFPNVNYDETGEPLTLDGTNDLAFTGAVTVSRNIGIQVNNNRVNVFSGSFNDGAGNFTLTKLGVGTLTLSGDNQYAGGTIVANGKLLVQNAPGGLGSGTGTGIVTVNSGATLGGNGWIFGQVINNGTIAPGASIGVLAISNSLTLNASSTVSMDLSPSGGTNDQIVGLTSVAYLGTLQLNNLGGTYTNTQTFKLFAAGSYSGAFTSVSPATPGPGQTWNTNNLPVNGTISVVGSAAPQPSVITNLVRLPNGSIQFSFNGPSGQNYSVYSSTNLALHPIASTWTLLSSGTFSGSPVTFTDSANTNSAARFYIVSQP